MVDGPKPHKEDDLRWIAARPGDGRARTHEKEQGRRETTKRRGMKVLRELRRWCASLKTQRENLKSQGESHHVEHKPAKQTTQPRRRPQPGAS